MALARKPKIKDKERMKKSSLLKRLSKKFKGDARKIRKHFRRAALEE